MSFGELTQRLQYDRTVLDGRSIIVLAGGGSSEREVSLDSGRAVYEALVEAGYNASLLVTGKDHLSIDTKLSKLTDRAQLALSGSSATETQALTLLSRAGGDPIVFTTLHGAVGEDGIWQGMLELLGVPYVSAGVRGSAVAIDKQLTKLVMASLGVPTPRWWMMAADDSCREVVPAEVTRIVGKPVDQGSSVGVMLVENDDKGWAELAHLANYYGRILVEEYIGGNEITAAIVGPSKDPVALPLVMIKPTRSFYDYTAKYTAGASAYTCPAPLGDALTEAIQRDAVRLYAALDLEPYSRIDCIVGTDGEPHFLEANTLPGFTVNSLLPKAAKAAGLDFTGLLEYLMCAAVERHAGREARR